MAITERTKKLKEMIVNKSFTNDKFKDDRIFVCPEKARYYTQSWKETESLPRVIRRAKTLEKILENITIFIDDPELIVGYPGSEKAAVSYSPERPRSILQELDAYGHIRDKDREEIFEIADYWKGKTPKDMMARYFTEDEIRVLNIGTPLRQVGGDYTQRAMPDHEYLFKYGLKGIIEKIKEKLDEVNREWPKVENLKIVPELAQKRDFFEAMIISCEAVIKYAERYAKLAEELAAKAKDPQRKKELLNIAKVCRRVPAYPPETFQEAVQCHYFIWIITHSYDHECHGTSDRIDQILWPCYEKEVIKDKTLTREEAQELVECLWIKITECGRLLYSVSRLAHQGTNMVNAYTIGGQLANGEDACNELTLVVLDATKSIRLNQPSLAFRYHKNISEEAVKKALEVVQTGSGFPSFKNDDVAIASLESFGYTTEEARDWCLIGCMSPGVSGKWGRVRRDAWSFTIAKAGETALNNGRDILNGDKLGPETGEPSSFKTYEEFVEAFRKQVRYFLNLGMRIHNMSLWLQAEYFPRPFLSALFERSITQGKDLMGTGDKTLPWINLCGPVDLADSFAAIKKLVFDEKKISLDELVEVLKNNWEGREDLRQMCIHDAPKFGNDDDYVDQIAARDVFGLAVDEMNKLRDIWGGVPSPLPQGVSAVWSQGKKISALPNGRFAREALADGGISPGKGYDEKGPTAILKSVSKVDHKSLKACLLNQRLNPSILSGEKGEKLFLSYMKTWHDLGIDHIQYNVTSTKTLLAAQKEPEKHRDVMVRVAGYSAFFVDLSKELQKDIIERTVHKLPGSPV